MQRRDSRKLNRLNSGALASRPVDGRNTHGETIIGDIEDYYCVCTDNYVVADQNRSQHLGTRTDVDIIADHRRSRLIDSREPDDDAIANSAVVTKLSIATNDDSAKMIYGEIAADLSLAWQFDSSYDLDEFERNAVEQGEKFAQQWRPYLITPSTKSVNR